MKNHWLRSMLLGVSMALLVTGGGTGPGYPQRGQDLRELRPGGVLGWGARPHAPRRPLLADHNRAGMDVKL